MPSLELRLALVPDRQELRARRRANEARVDQPREAHPGDVPGLAVDPVEVPARLRGLRAAPRKTIGRVAL